jgi:hypothetical protein
MPATEKTQSLKRLLLKAGGWPPGDDQIQTGKKGSQPVNRFKKEKKLGTL